MLSEKVPIDVICLIDKNGKITPLKIRMENSEGETVVSKINEVVYSKENKFAGTLTFDYGCKVNLEGVDQLIEIRFIVAERLWRINKVIWS